MLQDDHIGCFSARQTPDGPMVVFYSEDSEEPITLPDTEYDWGRVSFGSYLLARDILEIVGGAEGREMEFMTDVIAKLFWGWGRLPVCEVVGWREGYRKEDDPDYVPF